jgi:hypothetical protein
MRAPLAIVLGLGLLAACSKSGTAPSSSNGGNQQGSGYARTVTGQWGGDQVNLDLAQSGGTVEYACGAGTIDAGWTLEGGRFTATGTQVTEGGPAPAGGFPSHPARYDGVLNGSRLLLTVTLTDAGTVLGPFHLVRGSTVQLVKCY